MSEERLTDIFEAPAFQCHKTIDYDHEDDPLKRQGDHPQQCAGLMSVLHSEGRPNQIMQIAERLDHFDPSKLCAGEAYLSMAEAIKAHTGAYPIKVGDIVLGNAAAIWGKPYRAKVEAIGEYGAYRQRRALIKPLENAFTHGSARRTSRRRGPSLKKRWVLLCSLQLADA